MAMIREFFQNLLYQVPAIGISDIVDILVVSIIFYSLLRLIRSTSAARVARAILLLLAITLLTDVLNLYTLNWLLNKILEVGAIALIIVFQPELRRILEKLGSKSFREILSTKQEQRNIDYVISETVKACEIMSRERTGVLIVFERTSSLEDYQKTGIVIDARVSSELLRNIFFTKASLHDGAVIIRRGRILGAGCMLPLSKNVNLSRDLGMRHRAGIGMSENSDAVVVIVSEETGSISVAIGGMLKRHLMPETLRQLLCNELMPQPEEESDKPRLSLRELLHAHRKGEQNGNQE